MLFRDIIGQQNVKERLRKSVLEGRIPHALMLSGPEGTGKLQLAIAFAQYLNCTHRTEEDACGVCPTCLQYGNLQHPDLHFAFPIVKSDKGDTCNDFLEDFRQLVLTEGYFSQEDWYRALGVDNKQGMIYEKESSEILRKLSLKAFGEGWKVMIIWQPEKMNQVCANKLLKLLEEPPEQTVFLLVTEQPDQLLPTIVSRVQQIRVQRLPEEELATRFPADIAHIASGSYLAAKRLAADNEENSRQLEDFIALMRRAWLVANKKDYSALLELRRWSTDMADSKVGREKQKAFLRYAQQQVRENYIRHFGEPSINYQTDAEAAFSRNFAAFINDSNAEAIMQQLALAEQQIVQNGNAKIIFFDLCLQMIVLIKKPQ
jgi:DNA polymerase-3 subunit delta'